MYTFRQLNEATGDIELRSGHDEWINLQICKWPRQQSGQIKEPWWWHCQISPSQVICG